MAVWKAEISYSDADISGGSITSDRDDSIGATLWLIARDEGTRNYWGIRSNIGWHSYEVSGVPVYEYNSSFVFIAYVDNGFEDYTQPWTWSVIINNSFDSAGLSAADGDNGAVWRTGGILYIEKDTVAKTITFSTPIGSYVLTDGDEMWNGPLNLSGQFFSTNAMYALEFAHSIIRYVNVFGQTTSETAKWFHFFTSLGGVNVSGAQLSAADPGDMTALDTVISGSFYDGTIDDVQETLKLKTGLTLHPGSPAPGEVIHEHIFNAVLQSNYLDALVDPATGVLFYTTVRTIMTPKVMVGYSFNDGHQFQEKVVDEMTDTTFSYPSITADPNGIIYVFYMTSATDRLYFSFSRNKGRDWSTPDFFTVLNPPIDRPKARFHPTTGVLYLFYFDVTGLNTLLDRFDVVNVSSLDASAVLVRALATGPYDPYFDANGRILLCARSTIDGSRALVQSIDTGNSWDDLSIGDITANPSHAQVTTESPDLGLGAVVYQSDDGGGSGTFYAYLTPDNGQTIQLGENIIITGTELQEFGFVKGPNHQFYLIFLAGSSPGLIITCWISRDFVHFWAGA